MEPSDHLVSRVYREIKRWALQVKAVWLVRTQAHQMRVERKRDVHRSNKRPGPLQLSAHSVSLQFKPRDSALIARRAPVF